VCEERILSFLARSPKAALAKAKQVGRDAEFKDERDGAIIFFEFVGVMQLLDMATDDGEVWYEIVKEWPPASAGLAFIPPSAIWMRCERRPRKEPPLEGMVMSVTSNPRLQRTALRAAAEPPGRWAETADRCNER
jgi:hypothetical protein